MSTMEQVTSRARVVPSGRILASKANYVFLVMSLMLYIFSLTQICFYTGSGANGAIGPGFILAAFGWLAMSEDMLAWFANPLIGMAWLFSLVQLRIVALLLGLVALGLALSFLLQTEVMVDRTSKRSQVLDYALGYWMWVSSIAVCCAGNLIAELLARMSSTVDLPIETGSAGRAVN
jgi:hypothetical protein